MTSELSLADSQPNELRRQAAFHALWLFIILVSVLDGFLALRNRQLLHAYELNPVGRTLIAANGGQVWYLLAAKFVGTVVACALLLLIRQHRPRLGLHLALALAVLQFCLLLFLCLA